MNRFIEETTKDGGNIFSPKFDELVDQLKEKFLKDRAIDPIEFGNMENGELEDKELQITLEII